MKKRYVLIFASLFVLGCGDPGVPLTPVPNPTPASITQQLLDAHNKFRADNGKPPLKLNAKLQAAADSHSQRMANVRRMAHYGIGDGYPWDRVTAAGYNYGSVGENVAWNQSSVTEVMGSWQGSPGHRANILGDFTDFGGAVITLNGGPYWAIVFGSELKGSVVDESGYRTEGNETASSFRPKR